MSSVSNNSDRPLPVGFLLNNTYRIEEVLIGSEFAFTYKAKDTKKSDNLVAIKELFPKGSTRNHDNSLSFTRAMASYKESFRQEIEILHKLSALKNPNIVLLDTSFDLHGTIYMVMPYIGDTDLESKGILSTIQATRHITKISAAVKEIHKQGYLHLDIKPRNIILSSDDSEPVLIDFGSARKANDNSGKVCTGTDGFVSPEQKRGSKNLNQQADIYALAATHCYLVTGHTPPIIRNDKIGQKLTTALANALCNDLTSRTKTIDDFIAELTGQMEPVPKCGQLTKRWGQDRSAKMPNQTNIRFGWAVILSFFVIAVLTYVFLLRSPLPLGTGISITPTSTIHTSATSTSTPMVTVTAQTATPVPSSTNTPFVRIEEVIKATASAAFENEAARSMVWGTPISLPSFERDRGRRLVVQYYEKGRMEYDPEITSSTVTGALLTAELLDGVIQENRDNPVKGSPCRPMFDDSNSITYYSFREALRKLTDSNYNDFAKQQISSGYAIITINPDSSLAINLSRQNSENAKLVRHEHGHDIPIAFCNYLMSYLQSDSNWCDPSSTEDLPKGFWNLTGHPISEPYWTPAHFSGHTHDVMFQAFERRILTYSEQVGAVPATYVLTPVVASRGTPTRTPTRLPTPEIISSNIGIHYFEWRYPQDPPEWPCR